jgi:hypothetical protein
MKPVKKYYRNSTKHPDQTNIKVQQFSPIYVAGPSPLSTSLVRLLSLSCASYPSTDMILRISECV